MMKNAKYLIIVLLFLFLGFLLNKFSQIRNLDDYEMANFERVEIAYVKNLKTKKILIHDSTFIINFFRQVKKCSQANGENIYPREVLKLKFKGDFDAEFQVFVVDRNKVIVADVNPNITLVGKQYLCNEAIIQPILELFNNNLNSPIN